MINHHMDIVCDGCGKVEQYESNSEKQARWYAEHRLGWRFTGFPGARHLCPQCKDGGEDEGGVRVPASPLGPGPLAAMSLDEPVVVPDDARALVLV